MLLTACQSDPSRVKAPNLQAPTPGVVSALTHQCKDQHDVDTCNWIVSLEKHYEKLD